MKRAVFLDKDGTLVENVPYNVDPEKIVLLPTVGEGLHTLASRGYLLIVVSNQSGVARGFFKEEDLKDIYHKLQELVAPYHVAFDDFYYCPHLPEGKVLPYAKRCYCRKPSAGLFFKASEEYKIDLSKSFIIGDILDDCEAGRRAGCKTILIDNGNETEWKITPQREPHSIVKTFAEAATNIADQTIQKNETTRKEYISYE